ncbi:MAG: PspC domain-containing protein, partial [Planctomycetia bacterium]|nr:PspC domain-containing protein [Planctomycetia bacterium]
MDLFHSSDGPLETDVPYDRRWVFNTAEIVGLCWLFLIPAACSGIAKAFGFPVTWRRLVPAYAVFLAGVPLSIYLIHLTHVFHLQLHIISAGAIHTIKTGFVVPFIFISLGIFFLPHRSAGKIAKAKANNNSDS